MGANTPLHGQTVVVTRPRAQAGKLAERLEAAGAKVIEFPTIEIVYTEDVTFFDQDPIDWIIFTSANGVIGLQRLLKGRGLDLGAMLPAKVCAVGPATEQALRHYGVNVDLVPAEYNAEGIIRALKEKGVSIAGCLVLLPRGKIARPELPDTLKAMGANVSEAMVYDTICPEISPEQCDKLVELKPDWVTFTSGSTAANFARMLGEERLKQLVSSTGFASIGPQTSAACTSAGIPVTVEASRHDVDGLIRALMAYAERKRHANR